MLPVFSDRRTDWPSHPYATRDSLHEHEMWVAEGLTHRYPTKVLAEILPTCPQYCGHCTRMDLVGNSTPVIDKLKFVLKPVDRLDAMIDYLEPPPGVRDVVVSGGDVANMPWKRLEEFVDRLLEVENIRDIRLATKALMGLPQYWLSGRGPGRDGAARQHRPRDAASTWRSTRMSTRRSRSRRWSPRRPGDARGRGPRRPQPGRADARRERLGRRSCSTCASRCSTRPAIMPYYFYMCDMIPFSEHWRVSVAQAQELQHGIMGYLPGFATPRIVCDVPYVGKRWVHQLAEYDRERGISYWTKNYRTGIEMTDPEALERTYEYYDPIDTLPERARRGGASTPNLARRGRRACGRVATGVEGPARRLRPGQTADAALVRDGQDDGRRGATPTERRTGT